MSPIRPTLFAALVATLAGCATEPTDGVHVTLVGDKALNPARDGSANPAQVRLYLLESPDKFKGADYFQLFDKEQATLGTDLASRAEQIIRPGETKEVVLPTKSGARFVGIAVAYRAIDSATWRAVVPVAGRVRVALGASAVAAR